MEAERVRVARAAEVVLLDAVQESRQIGRAVRPLLPAVVQLGDVLERNTRQVGGRQLAQRVEDGTTGSDAQEAQVAGELIGAWPRV